MANKKLSKETKEILCILQEECAEVTQAISKIFRFGVGSVHPVTGVNNIDQLEFELGDLFAMMAILMETNFASRDSVEKYAEEKLVRLKKWSNIDFENLTDVKAEPDLENEDDHGAVVVNGELNTWGIYSAN